MTSLMLTVEEAAKEGADALAYRIDRLRGMSAAANDAELVVQLLARWEQARTILRAMGGA